jgi:hypothetical protein
MGKMRGLNTKGAKAERGVAVWECRSIEVRRNGSDLLFLSHNPLWKD